MRLLTNGGSRRKAGVYSFALSGLYGTLDPKIRTWDLTMELLGTSSTSNFIWPSIVFLLGTTTFIPKYKMF